MIKATGTVSYQQDETGLDHFPARDWGVLSNSRIFKLDDLPNKIYRAGDNSHSVIVVFCGRWVETTTSDCSMYPL